MRMARFKQITDWKKFIVLYPKVIPEELCNEIAHQARLLAGKHDRIHPGMYTDIRPADGGDFFEQLEDMCQVLFDPYYEMYRYNFNLTYGELVYDSISLTHYNPGSQNEMHIDLDFLANDGTRGASGPIGASCPVVSASSYKGGELYFLNQDFTIKPDIGDLLLFPSNFAYPHRVNLIEGERICVFPYYRHVAPPHARNEDTLSEVSNANKQK
jgi:hypothetical protein